MQNVLKRENMYLDGFQLILNFPLKIIFFKPFESIDMHIENDFKKHLFFCHCQNGFCPTGRGRELLTCPQLIGFLDAFP